MNYTTLNKIFSYLEWFLSWSHSKTSSDLIEISETIKKVEPFADEVYPSIETIINDLGPALNAVNESMPSIIALYNKLQPVIVAAQKITPVIQKNLPEYKKLWDTSQPAFKAVADLIDVNKKKKGMTHEQAVQHVTNQIKTIRGSV